MLVLNTGRLGALPLGSSDDGLTLVFWVSCAETCGVGRVWSCSQSRGREKRPKVGVVELRPEETALWLKHLLWVGSKHKDRPPIVPAPKGRTRAGCQVGWGNSLSPGFDWEPDSANKVKSLQFLDSSCQPQASACLNVYMLHTGWQKDSGQAEIYRHRKLKAGLMGCIRKGVVCMWHKFLDIYDLSRE